MTLPAPWRRAALGAALYLVLGTVWILGSDAVVAALAPDARWASTLQSVKGLFYVALTAALAAWLLARTGQAEQGLDDAARDNAAMLDAAQVGLARLALDGHVLWANGHLSAMLGHTPDELCTLDFDALTHPDDRGEDAARRQALLDGPTTTSTAETRHLRRDGSTVHVLCSLTLVGDADGQPRWFVAAVQDVSERQAALAAAEQAQQRLRDVIRALPDPVAVRDTQGRYLLANAATLALIGRPAREVIGQPVEALFSAERAAMIRDTDRRALEVGGLAPFRSVIRQGGAGNKRWLEVRVSVLHERNGRVAGLLSVSRDITELHERELALDRAVIEQRALRDEASQQRRALLSALEDADRSRQRLQAVVSALPDLVFLFDGDGRFVELWSADPAQLMMPREQALGRLISDLLPEPLAQQAMQHLRASLQGGGLQTFEYTLPMPDGEKAYEMRLCLAGPGQVLAVARDVTAERQSQQAARRAEQRVGMVLEASGDGWWDWNLDNGKVDFSAGFHRLLRNPGERFAQRFEFADLLHPEDRDATLAAMRATIDDRAAYARSFRLRCFDGTYRWFLARGGVRHDGEGAPKRFAGILTDLTERLRADEQQRLAAAVFEHTQEGVMITDASERIVSVNPAFSAMLGWSAAEVLGRTPRLLASGQHPPEFFARMWQGIARDGHWKGEIVNRTQDGRAVPQLMSISSVRDAQGHLTHYVGVFNDISQLKQTEARLDFLAHHDPLTSLPNRLLLSHRLDQALDHARRHGQTLAVLLFDLDHFKDVNDSWGHATGDRLLQMVAQRLRARLRRVDTLARLGGDEFALVLGELHDSADAARLAVELQSALAEPWVTDEGLELNVAASIGIALFPDHGGDAPSLLAHADAALYRAKADGRGVFRFYADEMTVTTRARLQLESKLRRAVALGQLVLHWQPQVEIASRRIVGAEALVRWNDPDAGLVAPADFIPVAEASGLIAGIGAWVLAEACRQGRRWRDAGLPPLTVAVNVSARQFQLGDVVALVQAELAASGLPPSLLELEITESTLMGREAEAPLALSRLRAMGVRLAIDDFGTGHSSLATLKRYPVHQLKIDRSFVAHIPQDPDEMEIAATVIAMGHTLGLGVLAEGVETLDQLAFLRLKGCDRYQGYLMSPPVPADAFEALLRAHIAGWSLPA